MKEKDLLIFYTSIISTVIITINLFTLYYSLVLLEVTFKIPNKYYTIALGLLIYIINYNFIVKKRKFLDYNFEKSKMGNFFTIGVFIVTATCAILVANMHRAKFFNL